MQFVFDEGNWDDLQETIRFREIAFPQRRGNYNIRITDKLKQLDRDTEDFYVTIVAGYCKPPPLGDEMHDLENIIKVDKVAIEIYDKELGLTGPTI